jgi:hypothetical protein
MSQEDLIARLARQIDTARKSEQFLVDASDVSALRRRGAAELHAICAEFVASVNSRLSGAELELSPPIYSAEMFRETAANVIQVGSQGRQVQITFHAPARLFSTDKFLVPYVLEGEVRAYNQKMLDRFEIRTELLFYCVEHGKAAWRFFDWRTRHTGLLGLDLLASLMGRLF